MREIFGFYLKIKKKDGIEGNRTISQFFSSSEYFDVSHGLEGAVEVRAVERGEPVIFTGPLLKKKTKINVILGHKLRTNLFCSVNFFPTKIFSGILEKGNLSE
jgi:hypothetical protein